MNQLQTEYFLSVAETRNITESARRLYVSPPAVSRQIRTLEEDLGFRLFERTFRGVRLLPEGERLRELLLSNQQKLASFRRDVLAGRMQSLRTLRFGLLSDWMPVGLLHALRRFLRQQEPEILLELKNGDFEQLQQMLADEQIDLVLYLTEPSGFRSYLFREQYLCPLKRVILYGQNPEEEEPTLQALSSLPLLITSESVKANSAAICISHNITPEIRILNNMNAVLQAVGAGQGFCITDEWCWAANHAGFGRLELPDRTHASILWKADAESDWLRKIIVFLAAQFAT